MNSENTPLLSPNGNEESAEEYRSRWRSIRVLYFTNFLSSLGFSIVMPSVWPFLKVLDSTVQTSFLGFVIGAFSFGQLLASPIMGYLANSLQRTAPPLILGLIFQITGNFLWAYLQDLPVAHGYLMICARILIGVGAGTMAAIRAYVSKATTLQERTKANAMVSTCQALGFIIGPGLQAALVPLGNPGPIDTRGIHVNMYTAPGWFGAIFGIINLLSIVLVFREHSVPDEPELGYITIQNGENSDVSTPSITGSSSMRSEESKMEVGIDLLVAWIFLFLFFIVLFIFVMFETISTPLSMYEYGWSKAHATLYIGIIWASTGVITIGVIALVSGPLQRFGERLLLLLGFAIIIGGFVVYLPYFGAKPPIEWVNATMNSSAADDGGGCPSNLSWCFQLPQIHLAQMLLATFFLSLGYPTVNLLTSTLYSKVLGPKPQGVWMGLFTAAGSLARMVGPVYVGSVFQHYGPLVTLTSGGGLAFIAFIIVACIYRRIIPYSERNRRFLESQSVSPVST